MWPWRQSMVSFESFRSYDEDTWDILNKSADDNGLCYSKQNAMRTQTLLLDYKQFKAARVIQRHFRGFRVRNALKEMGVAATVIQRFWRHYISKRKLIVMAQELTQASIIIKFNQCSLKIQSLFRGWWSRKYVNNMMFLKQIRLNCMEDLLNAFATSLHTQKRTGHLPGCFDYCKDHQQMLQDLLSTLNYRFFNRYVTVKYVKAKAELNIHQRSFRNSTNWTVVPYDGFNHLSTCKPAPLGDMEPKEYGLHEYDIIQTFLKANRITTVHMTKLGKSKKKKIRSKPLTEYENEQRFCRDLVKSMRFWHVCQQCQVKITDSFMTTHIDSFLSDIKLHLEDLKYVVNCNCERDTGKDIYLGTCE